MGICQSKTKELFTDHVYISIEIINKVLKSVCKITIKKKGGKNYECGTGFFMNINDSKKYLLTNYHIISDKIINEDIEIEIHNHKIMHLKLNNRYTKYFPEPKDITIIEIKQSDEIYDDIELLDYDLNFQKGYHIYKNLDVFSIEYPQGKNAVSASGKIKDIDDFEFEHTIPTDNGSSGSPIILLINNNINLIQVIGIHKEADYYYMINRGTFIGEIFKNNDFNNNIQNIRILNSYEEKKNIKCDNVLKNENNNNLVNNEIICIYNKKQYEILLFHDFSLEEHNKDYKEGKNNINEKNIEIYINDEKVEFNCKYKNNENREIKVKFKINKLLTSTNSMFYGCSSLKSINLSSFNSTNVNNMKCMFCKCSSLESINLSSFNTINVKSMECMFYGCSSLKSLDLSSFNTINVIDMRCLFYGCSSLKSLDLSSFNTTNVKNMICMFYGCSSLKSLDLTSFNTTNVQSMAWMFEKCSSLMSLDLSSFKTTNIKDMSAIFRVCTSLKVENVEFHDIKIFYGLKKYLEK